MSVEPTETFASSQGEVRWARIGEGPPIVLVHGWPFSSWIWHDVAAGLATRHTVYIWDLPAYGRSEKRPGQDVTLAGHAAVFAELLAHWGLATGPGPTVVAHDIGGAVALRTHLLHGVPYARLALVDAVAVAPWGSEFFRLVREEPGTFARIPLELHGALVRGYISGAGGAPPAPETVETLAAPWLDEPGRDAFYRQIAALRQEHTDEIEYRYGELDLPVLICWGTEDAWIPAESGRKLAKLVPGARLRLLEGAGHLVPVQVPATLCGEVLTWQA